MKFSFYLLNISFHYIYSKSCCWIFARWWWQRFWSEDISLSRDGSSVSYIKVIRHYPKYLVPLTGNWHLQPYLTQNGYFLRYPYQQETIEMTILDVIKEQLNKRQPMDATSKNLIRFMTATCGYGEVRLLASQRLEMWLQNPKVSCSINFYTFHLISHLKK